MGVWKIYTTLVGTTIKGYGLDNSVENIEEKHIVVENGDIVFFRIKYVKYTN